MIHLRSLIMKLFTFIKGIYSEDERVVADIRRRLIGTGYQILTEQLVNYSHQDGCEHYVEHAGRPYFPGLVKYVSEYPIYGMILETPKDLDEENSIAMLRAMAGSTIKIRPEYKEQSKELEAQLPTMSIQEVEEHYILPAEGTIRYDIPVKYGYKFDITKNVIHTSDSKASAEREISIFEKAIERENSLVR